jgi:hypothetical protein
MGSKTHLLSVVHPSIGCRQSVIKSRCDTLAHRTKRGAVSADWYSRMSRFNPSSAKYILRFLSKDVADAGSESARTIAQILSRDIVPSQRAHRGRETTYLDNETPISRWCFVTVNRFVTRSRFRFFCATCSHIEGGAGGDTVVATCAKHNRRSRLHTWRRKYGTMRQVTRR